VILQGDTPKFALMRVSMRGALTARLCAEGVLGRCWPSKISAAKHLKRRADVPKLRFGLPQSRAPPPLSHAACPALSAAAPAEA
jgi:hypothetical protein